LPKLELHLNVDENNSALALLNKHCKLTNSQLKKAAQQGALWLEHKNTASKKNYTKRLRRVKSNLKQGDMLHFYYNEQLLSQRTPEAQLIADHGEYSIWYKPYGMLCQGSKWSDHCTINRYVENNIEPQRPAFIVHRLDRAASGLIIIAHSKKTARAFGQLFEQHLLTKTYHIICHGDHRPHPQPEEISFAIDNKKANSTFSLLSYDNENNLSLIKVNIGSGRKHQIRKHAAAIGLPVVGDRLHGDQNVQYSEHLNLQLCAVSLDFICPITNIEQRFTLPDSLTPCLSKTAELLTNKTITTD